MFKSFFPPTPKLDGLSERGEESRKLVSTFLHELASQIAWNAIKVYHQVVLFVECLGAGKKRDKN